MKGATRPQYYRLRRILELVREGARTGSLPNCTDFTRALEVSRRTLMRDLDFLRDDENVPLTYDSSRKGFRLTDETFRLPPIQLTRRELFSFSIARKLLRRFEGTPLALDMKSVFEKVSEALEGSISLDVESLTEEFSVLSEDSARVDPKNWEQAARAINRRERLRMGYQRFDGTRRTYALEPHHLAAYHGNWYLLAFNPHAGRMETFALSRCRRLEATAEHFTPQKDFSAEAMFRDAFGITLAEQPWKVRLCFSKAVATYIKERTWHPSQRLRERRKKGVGPLP